MPVETQAEAWKRPSDAKCIVFLEWVSTSGSETISGQGTDVTLILIASAIAIAITVPIFLSLHASRVPGVLTFAASATVASAHIVWRANGGPAAQDLLEVVIPSFMLLACLLMLSGFRQFVSRPALQPVTLVAILVPIAGLLAVFTFVKDSFVGRTIVSTGSASVIVGAIAWTMVRGWREADAPTTFKLFAIICASTVSAFFMSRWITIPMGVDSSSYFVEPTSWNLAVSSIRLLLFPTIYLSAILLVLGRTVTSLERTLTYDDLTGALSRRAFLEFAASYFGHRHTGDTALLILDIDHFKRVNDTHGHDIGDRALRHFVKVASKVLPSQARLGRLGGEEFAILLPASTTAVAASVGETILNAIRNAPLACAEQSIPMTASIGTAPVRPGDSVNDALKRADEALYRAKANGRDRLCLADEMISVTANWKLQGGERRERPNRIGAPPPLVPAS